MFGEKGQGCIFFGICALVKPMKSGFEIGGEGYAGFREFESGKEGQKNFEDKA